MKFDIPIALIIFNRPDRVKALIDRLRKIKPSKLYIIADGPREKYKSDKQLVAESREIINQIDWECKINKNFSEVNLGCKRRPITGIDWVFQNEKSAIILEDDCFPTEDFFRFMKWGLETYENNPKIGMISGSNLIDYKYITEKRNGFSRLTNIWGWGSWRRVWEIHNKHLSIQDIKENKVLIKNNGNLNVMSSVFWNEVFKHACFSNSIWDFQLQYTFFKEGLLSVYPKQNLVLNMGFDGDGTHTNFSIPEYVKKSKPLNNISILSLPADSSLQICDIRDTHLAKTVYSLNIFSTFKLWAGNIVRYLK